MHSIRLVRVAGLVFYIELLLFIFFCLKFRSNRIITRFSGTFALVIRLTFLFLVSIIVIIKQLHAITYISHISRLNLNLHMTFFFFVTFFRWLILWWQNFDLFQPVLIAKNFTMIINYFFFAKLMISTKLQN